MCAIFLSANAANYTQKQRENLFERELLCKRKLLNLDINSTGKCLEFGNVRERSGNRSEMEYGGMNVIFEKITFCGEF